MKLILLLPIIITNAAFAQNKPVKNKLHYPCSGAYDSTLKMEVYSFTDVMPTEPDRLVVFLAKNFRYTNDDDLHMSFRIEFIIDSNGKVLRPSMSKKQPENYTVNEKEMLRVISLMPLWKPGFCAGHKVAVRLLYPITLEL